MKFVDVSVSMGYKGKKLFILLFIRELFFLKFSGKILDKELINLETVWARNDYKFLYI